MSLLAQVQAPEIDYKLLSPLLALVGGCVVVMMVGLFRSQFVRRSLVPGLTAATILIAIGLTIWIWDPGDNRADHRGRARDGHADARALDALLRGGARGDPAVAARGRAAHRRPGRVLRAAARLDHGHGGAGRRREPDHALHRHRGALDPALRAVRDRAVQARVARVGAQVPRHRVGRLGDAPVRPGAHLRRDRLDAVRRHRLARSAATSCPPPTRCCSPASR